MRRILLSLALSLSLLFIIFKTKHIGDHTVRVSTPGLNPENHVSPSLSTGDRFHPLRLTECTGTTPGYYAPCLARTLPNVVSAEELIYPAFTISPPIFATSRPQDAERWWNTTWMMWERAYKMKGRMRYPEKHGQIYVFQNVTLSASTPFDKWIMQSCMSGLATTSHVVPSSDKPTHDNVLLANFPDSWSMQHFLDRGMRVVAQSRDHQTRYVATGREGHKSVEEFWSYLGYAANQVLHRDTSFVASQLIWSCRAPLIHPWLTQRSLSLLSPDSLQPVDKSTRKLILYMTRSNGLNLNAGREVLNEDILLADIQALLDKRGKREQLKIFNHEDFPSTDALMRYVHQNVKAVIGPHGSALHNHFWTAEDTLLIEFMPTSRPDFAFYEAARMRDQPYAVLMLDPVDDEHNMEVDVPAVLDILSERLDQPLDMSERLKVAYDWEAEELGVN
ncbi:hypothetical protein AnigIFM60653_001327 [Aspergillus niger]|nr:hypothetical protein AnigIFM60653_001327 [Aspergillus niger]